MSRRIPHTTALIVFILLLAVLPAVAVRPYPASADGPPSPGPYPKIFVSGTDVPAVGYLTCWDADGALLYDGRAWTLEPLVRGPLFAPVVLWLADAGNRPVVPLEFHSFADLSWRTVDGGPPVVSADPVGPVGGRPVGFGPAPTDQRPRVTCTSFDPQGYHDFGDYVMTRGLVAAMSLPSDLVGRTVNFDNEGTVTFTVPRTAFPLPAPEYAAVLPVPDWDAYSWEPLNRSATRCQRGSTVHYVGSATTLAPLVRGFRWAPMAMWLEGDRIATPKWFTSRVHGSWRTVSGVPRLAGRLDARQQGTVTGYLGRPADAADGVACTGSGPVAQTIVITRPLARQLSLPPGAVGRLVRLEGAYRTTAYVPRQLFPPAG